MSTKQIIIIGGCLLCLGGLAVLQHSGSAPRSDNSPSVISGGAATQGKAGGATNVNGRFLARPQPSVPAAAQPSGKATEADNAIRLSAQKFHGEAAAPLDEEATERLLAQLASSANMGDEEAARKLIAGLPTHGDVEGLANLADIIESVTNKAAAKPLIELLRTSPVKAYRRAAQLSLSRLADGEVVADLVSAYNAEQDSFRRIEIGMAVGYITNPDASQALLQVADYGGQELIGPLARFAVDAIGRVAGRDEADYLLSRIETAAPGELSTFINAASLIHSQSAYSLLRESSSDSPHEAVRVASILALGNYPDSATLQYLQGRLSLPLSQQENRAVEKSISRVSAQLAASVPQR